MKHWIFGIVAVWALVSFSFGQDSQAVWRKATGIVIDVKLENVSLERAVDEVRALSRAADTLETNGKWKGVRIGFDRIRKNEVGKRVTLDLKNVTVADALESVGDATGRRVDYFGDGVVLRKERKEDLDMNSDRLITRCFEISSAVFSGLMSENIDPFGASVENKVKRTRSVTEALGNRGVEFGVGAWVNYSASTGQVIVRNIRKHS